MVGPQFGTGRPRAGDFAAEGEPMSHHLDSPESRRDPRLNLTDLYVFDGTSGTAFVMVTNTSLAGDERTPGFHPEGRYEFKVHLDAADEESLTYRFTFGAPDGSGQALTAHRLTGADARDDAAEGEVVAHGRTDEVLVGAGDLRLWAGGAADPFYLDFHQLVHVIEALQNKEPLDLGEWRPDTAASSFDESQVYAIVLEVPTSDAELRRDRDVAAWGVTKLATDAGGWRQVNRAAIPMVWPLFRALGDADESSEYVRDTTAHPVEDRANDEARISQMVSAAAGFTGTADPTAYGRLVAERLLPDVLPYRVGTSAAFSFAGFNGRSLADNAPEVVYGLVTNSAVPTGLQSSAAASTRQDSFPYVVARPPAG